MHTVYLHKGCSYEILQEMRTWCQENCKNEFRSGTPPLAGFIGDQLEFYESSEIPWRFESEADAMLFKLRWLS